MTTRYIPHLIYALALTSISTHSLWHRKEAEEQRRHYTTRIALLEDTVRRLRAGEHVPESEFATLKKLASEPGMGSKAARGVEAGEGAIGWREVLLGRKNAGQSSTNAEGLSKWDESDLEKSAWRSVSVPSPPSSLIVCF